MQEPTIDWKDNEPTSTNAYIQRWLNLLGLSDEKDDNRLKWDNLLAVTDLNQLTEEMLPNDLIILITFEHYNSLSQESTSLLDSRLFIVDLQSKFKLCKIHNVTVDSITCFNVTVDSITCFKDEPISINITMSTAPTELIPIQKPVTNKQNRLRLGDSNATNE